MIHKPSIIKRPVLVVNGRVKSLGFDADKYETLFEPPRDFRRLHFLREWSYGKAKADKIFTRSS